MNPEAPVTQTVPSPPPSFSPPSIIFRKFRYSEIFAYLVFVNSENKGVGYLTHSHVSGDENARGNSMYKSQNVWTQPVVMIMAAAGP